jgi:hypothetical protein
VSENEYDYRLANWQGRQQPYFRRELTYELNEGSPFSVIFNENRDGCPFAFAGIWDTWTQHGQEPLRTCAIIRVPANEVVSPFHDRMPAILLSEQWDEWLDPATPEAELQSLMTPFPAYLMEAGGEQSCERLSRVCDALGRCGMMKPQPMSIAMKITLYIRTYQVKDAPVTRSLRPFPPHQKHTLSRDGKVHDAVSREMVVMERGKSNPLSTRFTNWSKLVPRGSGRARRAFRHVSRSRIEKSEN